MFIKPTNRASGSIFDVNDSIEPMLYPIDEEIPCPWDADITIDNGNVVLVGTLGPGGPAATNSCVCKCRIADFTNYYKLEIHNGEELIEDLEAAGWERA